MPILLLVLGLLQQNAAAAPPLLPSSGNPVVILDTSAGSLAIELFKDQAPVSVANFLQYVNDGFYPGTIWHRVIPGYVIQGGGYTANLGEKPTRPPIQNEATNGLSNRKGTVAMARTRAARSATSQFFINLADNPGLDHHGFAPDDFGYAVFGRVIEGWDVVEKIAAARTKSTPEGMENVPETPIVIQKVTVRSTGGAKPSGSE